MYKYFTNVYKMHPDLTEIGFVLNFYLLLD